MLKAEESVTISTLQELLYTLMPFSEAWAGTLGSHSIHSLRLRAAVHKHSNPDTATATQHLSCFTQNAQLHHWDVRDTFLLSFILENRASWHKNGNSTLPTRTYTSKQNPLGSAWREWLGTDPVPCSCLQAVTTGQGWLRISSCAIPSTLYFLLLWDSPKSATSCSIIRLSL